MSATCCKRPHVDIFICIEMRRERNLGKKKQHPVYSKKDNKSMTFFNVDLEYILLYGFMIPLKSQKTCTRS